MREKHYSGIFNIEKKHWWYRVRRSIVHDIISKNLTISEGFNILDVGCGPGLLLTELDGYGFVYGADVSPLALGYCRSRGVANLEQCSAEKLSYPDNFFNLLTCLDVLEHVEKDKKAIEEIIRVLKHGGSAIIFVPAHRYLWSITDTLSNHLRRYSKKEFVRLFEFPNISIKKISYFNTFLFLPISIVRLGVRYLHIPMNSENFFFNKYTNTALFCIFKFESLLLRHFSMPFGVSILAVIKKI